MRKPKRKYTRGLPPPPNFSLSEIADDALFDFISPVDPDCRWAKARLTTDMSLADLGEGRRRP